MQLWRFWFVFIICVIIILIGCSVLFLPSSSSGTTGGNTGGITGEFGGITGGILGGITGGLGGITGGLGGITGGITGGLGGITGGLGGITGEFGGNTGGLGGITGELGGITGEFGGITGEFGGITGGITGCITGYITENKCRKIRPRRRKRNNYQTENKRLLYTIVLLESEINSLLPSILDQIIQKLEENIIIFYGNKNKDYIESLQKSSDKYDRIQLINTHLPNFNFEELKSNPTFNSFIPTSIFLYLDTSNFNLDYSWIESCLNSPEINNGTFKKEGMVLCRKQNLN